MSRYKKHTEFILCHVNYIPQGGAITPPSGNSKFYYGGVRVRVSGGHLCSAEALTEPTGETTRPTDFCVHLNFLLDLSVLQIFYLIISVLQIKVNICYTDIA